MKNPAVPWDEKVRRAKRGLCVACGRKLRSGSSRTLYLYLMPEDTEAYVCNERCMARYNDEGAECAEEV